MNKDKIEKVGVWYKFGDKAYMKNEDDSIVELPAHEIYSWDELEDGEISNQDPIDIIKRWRENIDKNFFSGLA